MRHVPDLRMNLISGIALDRDGYESYFANQKWRLTKGSLVIAKGVARGTLYRTNAEICQGELNAAQDEISVDLWHKRMGHMSEKGLQILAKKSLISYAKGTTVKPCDYCLFGKQHRFSFQTSSERKLNILDLVYSDVCGPMEIESMGGNKYFVTFIDDASRKLWVYILKTKDQVFQVFQKFHALVERETGRKLKRLRSDNGGEYTSREFEEYCSSHGIRHEKTVPRTPQHNGVAERMNRTIVEKVRSMLRMAKLPKSFWGEAVQTACYLINRSPSVPLAFEIPERVWTNKEVSYSHLKVFGCRAFAHVPKEQRTKLDDKSIPCIFIGYGDEEFGYRLWDPVKKKVIRSRDVVFRESEVRTAADMSEKAKNGIIPNFVTIPSTSNNPTSAESTTDEVAEQGEQPGEVIEQGEQLDEGVEEVEHPTQGEEQPQPLRRSERPRVESRRYPSTEYVLISDEGEPESLKEVLSHPEKNQWMKAMQEEMESLQKNGTYKLVELPKGKRPLKCKWVFKLKKDGNGKLVRYKARLVVKGFKQKKGIDFDEIFSPVVKMTSIRTILSLAASLDLEVEQLDVKTAFLHGDLEEEIYMEQPEGFEVAGKKHMVCKLNKSLYGLKQAPRQWYMKFDSFMKSQTYLKTYSDPCVYFKRFSENNFIILLLYVDDMLIVGKDKGLIAKLKGDLSKSFDMKDLGPAQQILGMKIVRERTSRKLWLSQEKYIERVLERFNMKNAKPVSTPLAGHLKLSKKMCPTTVEEKGNMAKVPYSSAVGSLMYAMVCTRPDIAHAVGVVSRFLENPGKEHWEAVKWILRYLRGTTGDCLCFGGSDPILKGYTDADMAGDIDNRKSTTGYLFTFSGGAISWQSKLQKCVALSTTEAEYIAATETGKEMIWLKRFLQELGLHQKEYAVYCDSQSAIDLSKNSMYHARTKHIDVRYHWIREMVDDESLKVLKISTNENPSDMLTKVVPRNKFELCKELVGIDSN